MEEQAILCLGAFTLVGSGTELVRLHRGNPLLRGLNLMGQAIFVGGVAAALLFSAKWLPALQPLGTFVILVAFSQCHRAMAELAHLRTDFTLGTRVLLALQLVATLLQLGHLLSDRLGIVALSCTLVAEMYLTQQTVSRAFNLQDHSSARFIVGLLRFLIVVDLVRALAAAVGLFSFPAISYWSETATYGLFIAAGIGLGFGFFSMTTSSLTSELERLASTDPLTQICNRRAFLERCELELQRGRREQSASSLLLLDLDHFKQFNDTFGHLAGDEALRASVERIQNGIRGIDTVCRWGGEELAVLLPNATSEAAYLVAERIRLSFGELHRAAAVSSDWRSKPLTVSIGAISCHAGEESAEALLGRADQALYAAKRSGRNRTVVYERLAELEAAAPLEVG